MSESKESRKRTENYTFNEKNILTQLVAKYKSRIENKRTDTATNADKVSGWKQLAAEFNCISSHYYRTDKNLKTCWENIKRAEKKTCAARKREHYKTGGGIPDPPLPGTGAEGVVGAILGPSLEGLENPYDNDALEGHSNDDTFVLSTKDENSLEVEHQSDTQMNDTQSQDSCSIVFDGAGTRPQKLNMHKIVIMDKNPNNNLKEDRTADTPKWESWTLNSLKKPMSEVLKDKNSWLKRRRPDSQNLSDQLVQEKINLAKTLLENAKAEHHAKLLILEEQLKQEKIITQKLENGII
ncbi:myb/SANT-like DNA-binding domain-containing protein [Phthorimaea operculella]|nr:myb/SANT-like DNA-binding domain-containing protein [Phthorimaea operculella]